MAKDIVAELKITGVKDASVERALSQTLSAVRTAQTQLSQMSASVNTMFSKFVLGDIIKEGAKKGVEAISEMVNKVREFGAEALTASAKFERSMMGLSSTLGNKSAGEALGKRFEPTAMLTKLAATSGKFYG